MISAKGFSLPSSVKTAPRLVDGPDVWTAVDFPENRSWVRELAPAMIDEIKDATLKAKREGCDYTTVNRDLFRLPLSAALLQSTYNDLENGVGFSVIGGFPVDQFDYDDALLAYAGVVSHLGTLVDQSYNGEMKVDVMDTGETYSKDVRGYLSNAALRFHTDGASLIGLCCFGESAEGGASVLVSSGAMSNEILKRRPDLHAVLVEGFHHHRRGQHAPGDNPISANPIPVFGFFDDLLHCTYDRNQSLWSADEGVVFSAEQIEAMDLLDQLMAERKNQLHMNMQLGDIQVVNNFVVMHSRTEYTNDENHRRHLVRYWLENPTGKRRGLTMRDLYVRAA